MPPLPELLHQHPRQAAAVAAGAVVALGLAGYAILRKRLTPEELEARRREHLAANGRITDGSLIDATPDMKQPVMIIYEYRIAGVTYQCSQDVSGLPGPLQLPALDLPVQVRYDRANPGDSIVLAESWNGLWSVDTATLPLPQSSTQ